MHLKLAPEAGFDKDMVDLIFRAGVAIEYITFK